MIRYLGYISVSDKTSDRNTSKNAKHQTFPKCNDKVKHGNENQRFSNVSRVYYVEMKHWREMGK